MLDSTVVMFLALQRSIPVFVGIDDSSIVREDIF